MSEIASEKTPESLPQDFLKCTNYEMLGEVTFDEYQKKQLSFPSKIGIKNLPEGITESGIKNLFLTIGKPKFIEFFPRKASCLAEFSSWREAELAVRDLNNTPPYFLKVYMITPKTEHSSEVQRESIFSDEKHNYKPVELNVKIEDEPKKETEPQQPLEDTISEEELSRKIEADLQLQSVLESLSYDPSIRMRQKKLDFRSKWDCVSLGRGYFYTDMTDYYVGGLQTYSITCGKPNIEVNYNCQNCNALTTRICKNCNGSYCSMACLNNDVLDHKNSCKEARLKLESKAGENDASKKENKNSENAELSSSEENISDFKPDALESGAIVIISTYVTLQTVFVRRTGNPWEENFVKLSNDVAAAAMKEETLKPDSEVGDLCCARYYEDLCFYRARISSKENNEFTVQFIDYGNSQITKIEDLKPLPENLKRVPELAIKVNLKNVPKGSSLQAVHYFNKLTAERIPLIIEFKGISEGVVLKEEESRDLVNEKVTNYAMPYWKQDKSVLSKLGEVYFMEAIKTPALEVGKNYSLKVSHFFEKEFLESGVFWAIDVEADEFYHVKGEMKERITEYCEYLKDDYYLPRVNELCLAKEKGEWHRCVNLKSQKTACFLFFVDDGHSSVIETKFIRKIIKEFIEAPAQAVCCILSDDQKLKENKELQLKISNHLKDLINQTVKSVEIIEFLGDVYRVSLPQVSELMT